MTTTPNGSTPAGGQYGQNPQYDGGQQGYPQNGYPQQGYAPNGYPQQGQQWAPQEPPKKKNFFVRHKILTGLLALCVLIGLGTALGGGGKKDDAKSNTSASGDTKTENKDEKKTDEKNEAALPAVGTSVRDGKFEFTVTKVERDVASVGDQYLGQKAQGAYTLVHVTVKNISTETQAMMADGQKAYDAKGIGYEADSTASLYVKDNDTFFKEINPGNTLKGVLVFDAPKGTKLTKVRLHDSMFSNGVEASL